MVARNDSVTAFIAFVLSGVSYVEENKQSNRSLVLILTQTLEESLFKADVTSKSSCIVSGAIISESGTIPGDCGGNTSYTTNVDDVTGDFNATFDFNSYCFFSITFSGRINYSGKIDINTENLLYFTASFNNLTVVHECGLFTLQGNIYYDDMSVNTITGTMNALWRDNGTGKVYKVENYIVTFTVGTNYTDFVISGRYYDPDYGYATVSTTTQFRIYEGNLEPSQGVLVCTGNNGIAGGSTKHD